MSYPSVSLRSEFRVELVVFVTLCYSLFVYFLVLLTLSLLFFLFLFFPNTTKSKNQREGFSESVPCR